jgi:hypothetical protein
MKIEIEVPDEVIENIEHLIALGITNENTLKECLVGSIIADTRCTLESCNAELPAKWPNVEAPA